jgi:hypothetical protein
MPENLSRSLDKASCPVVYFGEQLLTPLDTIFSIHFICIFLSLYKDDIGYIFRSRQYPVLHLAER